MKENQYLILDERRKGFQEADTSSEEEGYIPPGKYLITDFATKDHDGVTQYANISVPKHGDGATWICIKWRDKTYARVENQVIAPQEKKDFSSDLGAIDESHLTDLLPQFYDFTYDYDTVTYPYVFNGFKPRVGPPYTNNCCTFVEALVVKAYQNARNVGWGPHQHDLMMINSDDFFSPVSCLVEAGIADPVADSDQPPHVWTVIQGWRKKWQGGHTFIILDYDEATDKVLTLESNAAFKMDGVGFRGLGALRDIRQPSPAWANQTSVWTWEKMKSVYQFRKQCVLKVKNLNWV